MYRDTTNVEQEMYDCKAIIGGPRIVTKGLKKNLKAIPKQHSIGTLQKTAVHEPSHTIQKVLQSETCSPSCGDHSNRGEVSGRKGL